MHRLFTNEKGAVMGSCSVTRGLRIVEGSFDDYKRLARLHYRGSQAGAVTAIFAIRPAKKLAGSLGTETIGVIAYRTPGPENELRNVATSNLFADFDRGTQLSLINKNIRCISRVIIEPRFRGLGLASRLVRETMPQVNVPIVEALAVMGRVNPFFEKAGMTAYAATMPARCVRLAEALSMVGIERRELIDPRAVQARLEALESEKAEFIEREIRNFLESYGEMRKSPASVERTRFVVSKLTERPVYYIWFNRELKLITS
jgi:hypothetical protein